MLRERTTDQNVRRGLAVKVTGGVSALALVLGLGPLQGVASAGGSATSEPIYSNDSCPAGVTTQIGTAKFSTSRTGLLTVEYDLTNGLANDTYQIKLIIDLSCSTPGVLGTVTTNGKGVGKTTFRGIAIPAGTTEVGVCGLESNSSTDNCSATDFNI